MSRRITIGVGGALGRMGVCMAEAIAARDDLDLTALFGRPSSEGQSVGARTLTTAVRALEAADVVIDFSSAEASVALAEAAAMAGRPALVIGATGFSASDEDRLALAASRVAIVKSGNFSIGVALLRALVEQAARRLGRRDWDIEVFEAHHRHKRDAPSGTALMLGRAAAEGRGVTLDQVAAPTRAGHDAPRREGEIGFAVVRAGGLVGEHSVVFAADDEVLVLSHSARNRRLFARGAIEAAIWVADRPPGLYAMKDVLGLDL